MPMLRTIDRPTNDTLRPSATAASMICCTRSTLEAKHATMTRPSAPRISRCSVGPTSLSDGPTPGISEFVESHRNRSTPASPSRDMPGRSVGLPSSGSWSSLMSPVCSTVPAPVCIAIARQPGIEWLTAKYSHSNTPCVRALALGDLDEHRLDAVFAALLRDQRQRELRADDRDVGPQLEQERDGADVVLVRVGQHQRLDVVEAVLDVPQVGQDQVDAGLVVAGEQHPAVDDQQPAEMLENGHVAADFADAAQRGDPQAAGGQRPRRCRDRVSTTRSTAAARMSAASASICVRRGRHLRQPRIADIDALQPQPRLGHRHPAQPALRVAQRAERDVDLAGGRDVAGGEGRQHVSQLARPRGGPTR